MSKREYTQHGLSGTPTYKSWHCMKMRVNDPSDVSYGGRGISMCEQWKDYEVFLRDMGERPEGTSIDRIDNDGDYTPENCRWADRVTQENNKSTNRTLTYNGDTLTVSQWASLLGLPVTTLFSRIYRGWSTDRVIEGGTA